VNTLPRIVVVSGDGGSRLQHVDDDLLAAAIGALDDYAQACNVDNAADLNARHARTWPSALATQRHNNQFGTQRKRSSDHGAADHNGGSACGYLPTHSRSWPLLGYGPTQAGRPYFYAVAPAG
jgi:hypothetical protein